jgi:hypothetical protein
MTYILRSIVDTSTMVRRTRSSPTTTTSRTRAAATAAESRCRRANGQPAVACYARRPGDDAYTPLAIDVLRIEEGAVKDITTFDGALLGMFDLPPRL